MHQEPDIDIGRERLFFLAFSRVASHQRCSTLQDLIDSPTVILRTWAHRNPITGNRGGLALGSLRIRNRSDQILLAIANKNITLAALDPLNPPRNAP